MMKQRKGLMNHRWSELKKTSSLATVGPAKDRHQAPTQRLNLFFWRNYAICYWQIQVQKRSFSIRRISLIQLKFSRIYTICSKLELSILSKSSKYLEVELKASIILVWLVSLINNTGLKDTHLNGNNVLIQGHNIDWCNFLAFSIGSRQSSISHLSYQCIKDNQSLSKLSIYIMWQSGCKPNQSL